VVGSTIALGAALAFAPAASAGELPVPVTTTVPVCGPTAAELAPGEPVSTCTTTADGEFHYEYRPAGAEGVEVAEPPAPPAPAPAPEPAPAPAPRAAAPVVSPPTTVPAPAATFEVAAPPAVHDPVPAATPEDPTPRYAAERRARLAAFDVPSGAEVFTPATVLPLALCAGAIIVLGTALVTVPKR
jgi:hypothetical protein